MSIDVDLDHAATARPSPAADVSFAAAESRHGESSSRAQSRSSSARGSSHSFPDKFRGSSETRSSTAEATSNQADSIGQSKIPQRVRKPGGFLLGSVLSNGHVRASDHAPGLSSKRASRSHNNGHIQLDKPRNAAARISGESSHGSSPLSRQLSSERSTKAGSGKLPEARPPAMDPAQLVQMALNLSESRKRHSTSALPVPITPAGSRRVVSAMDSGYGTVRSASSAGKRASYSNESRIPTPVSHRHSPHREELLESPIDLGRNIVHTFSPATLFRTEKARRYFELASEHRRLLENLPPLRPDATAAGNYSMQATSSPGSAHYHMTRITSSESVHKHKLGRQYNPLQALRNRRIRNRQRRPLTAPTETFQETDRIRRWIDGVEAAAKNSSFRPGEDQVRLPPFSGELEADPNDRPDTARGHRRTDTTSSVIVRPENGWMIEPAELLADTYWVEKHDNKTLIEDRNGHRLFPARTATSLEAPRRSKDITRRSMEVGKLQDHNGNHRDDSDASESEEQHRAKHKSKHILPLPRLGRGHVNRSGSVSSISSDEGRRPPALRFGHDEGGDENIGPLERHMREMIAKDEKGELSSPELLSPDHWDTQNTSFPTMRTGGSNSRHEINAASKGRLSVDTQRHQRSTSDDSKGSMERNLPSMNEMIADSPSSPVVPDFSRQSTSESTFSKQASPVKHKSKGLKLPLLHSRSKSKERNHIEATDFASNTGAPLSPVLSADSGTGGPRCSIESARPAQFRRHKTSDSIDSELLQTYTNTTTTASSTKGSKTASNRFFKGGRVRDIVRNESSRFGDRFRASREGVNAESSVPQSDASDGDVDHALLRKRNDEDNVLDDGISPRASLERPRPKAKYFTSGLPSFRSPAARDRAAPTSPLSEDSNPFDKLHALSRSRQQELPKINLPDDGNVSEPELSPNKAQKGLTWAETYKRRRSVSQNDLTLVETDSRLSNMKIRNGQAGGSGKRHWSISDNAQRGQMQNSSADDELPSRVTARDIARVRALLLASGIKAQEICHMANSTRERPLPIIVKAAEVAGHTIEPMTRKEENVAAGQWLCGTVDGTIVDLEKLLQRFQGQVVKDLSVRLEALSHKAGDQLTKRVHETSDEADAFNVELTTRMPQDIKRMDNTIDSMFRARRKNFRLLINVSSKLFEWLLLGIMWSIWLIVVVVNSLKKVILALFRFLKWLTWF
ncbi:unnamed protein product [Cercospora beticola]|nr:unnamed protein product [Cercospora beticola]